MPVMLASGVVRAVLLVCRPKPTNRASPLDQPVTSVVVGVVVEASRADCISTESRVSPESSRKTQ
jgi:hypothetical protein